MTNLANIIYGLPFWQQKDWIIKNTTNSVKYLKVNSPPRIYLEMSFVDILANTVWYMSFPILAIRIRMISTEYFIIWSNTVVPKWEEVTVSAATQRHLKGILGPWSCYQSHWYRWWMVTVEMEGHIVPIVKKQSGQKVGPTIKPQGPPPCPTSIRNVIDAENWACYHCNFSCSFHRQELGLRCSVCCTERLRSPDPRLLYVSESGLWYETSLLPSLPRMQFCQMLEAKDTACRWEEKGKKKKKLPE